MINVKQLLLIVCCCMAVNSKAGNSADSTTCTSDCCCAGSTQTPVGIMTDHVHGKGQWMVEYMYMNMLMNGNRTGTSKTTDDIAAVKYLMVPGTMSMQMHMAMLMYGLTDRITLMAMGGYSISSMSMAGGAMTLHSHMGGSSSMHHQMSTSGITDTRVYALYSLLSKPNHRVIVTGGVNIPSGSINKTTDMYGSPQTASYCMQPGTGSFALLPSVTYVYTAGSLALGAQAAADVKLGRNMQNYKFGNNYSLNVWGSYHILSFMSVSLRAEAISTGTITGYDKDVAIYMNNDPTADAANYGGMRVTTYAGLNISFNKPGRLHLLVECGLPAYQNVNGLQMSAQANILAGIQYTF